MATTTAADLQAVAATSTDRLRAAVAAKDSRSLVAVLAHLEDTTTVTEPADRLLYTFAALELGARCGVGPADLIRWGVERTASVWLDLHVNGL